MKRILEYLGTAVLCVAMWSACDAPKDKKKVLGDSKGLPYELLLVVDEPLWEGATGDSLRSVVEASVPGLPQNEPMFRMTRVYPRHFTRMYVTMRNVLVVHTDPKVKKVRMGVANNVEARPQVWVTIETPNAQALGEFLSRNRRRITDIFVEAELQQEAARLTKKYNREVDAASRKIFGCSVKVPAELAALKKAEDFLWASTDRVDQDMNYVCYSLPLVGEDVLLTDRLVELRDSAMKRNIPGSTPEKWMTTTYENGLPLVAQRTITLPDGSTAYEMRGLWEMHKGGIGGPFVSLAYPDTLHGRVLVTEGFIYSPRTKKRDLMRRMEAALRTLKPVEP